MTKNELDRRFANRIDPRGMSEMLALAETINSSVVFTTWKKEEVNQEDIEIEIWKNGKRIQ